MLLCCVVEGKKKLKKGKNKILSFFWDGNGIRNNNAEFWKVKIIL